MTRMQHFAGRHGVTALEDLLPRRYPLSLPLLSAALFIIFKTFFVTGSLSLFSLSLMESYRRSSSCLLHLLLILAASSFPSSWAYDFYVGGEQGWVANPSESYSHWGSRNRFRIKDKLVFKHKGEDSVLEVNEADFNSCNTSNPIKKHGDDVDSVVVLDRSGPFFFISGVPSKCREGEKLVVVVLAARPMPYSPSPSPASTPFYEVSPVPPPQTSVPEVAPPPSALGPASPQPCLLAFATLLSVSWSLDSCFCRY